jgi:Amt family ammonium transporter
MLFGFALVLLIAPGLAFIYGGCSQLKAVLFTYGFVALGTALTSEFQGLFMKLRVSAESEDRGLDFVAHGEEAYEPMTN